MRGPRRRPSPSSEEDLPIKRDEAKPVASKRPMSLPDGFMRKDNGIWFNPKGEGTTPYHVCGPLDVVAQTRDDFGTSWGYQIEWTDDDGQVHTWAMSKSLLAGDGAEIRATLLDGGCFVSPAKHARGKLMELLSTVKVKARARAVNRVGWANGAFALPDRTIGETPENRVIYQGAEAFDHAYRTKGDLSGWQNNIARLCVGNSRMILAIAAGFVGPLLTLLGEEGPGINLRGPSSIGKSTALIAAASIWGPAAFVRQWRATANGLEGVCVQHNETLLCLDELAQLDAREAGHVAYLIANGMGKARANRSGALRSPFQWKVPFLSSGEISLADLAGRDARGTKRSAAGQEVRILDCEADAGMGLGLFETLHDAPSAEALARSIKDGAAQTHGTAGPAFVERIIASSDNLAPSIKKEIDAFVADNLPPKASGQVARAARRFGLIASAGELAVRLEILPWPEGASTDACAAIFDQWLIGRGGTGAAEDRDAIAKVRGFLELHGVSRFESVDGDDDTRVINRAGFWRDSDQGREYLFLAETWKAEVCAGMDARRVAKVLADHGLLRRDGQGKNSISATLPAGIGKTRCYAVSAAIFEGGT
jgi:putative DNA primase/helicase